MRKGRKLLSLLLASAMALSLAIGGAAAAPAPGGPGGGEGGPGGGPGGPGGAPGGESSSAIDLSGMLALSQYVFVNSQDEVKDGAVTADCYGVYAEGKSAAFAPVAFQGALSVYEDEEMTRECADVTAEVSAGAFTLSGVDQSGNTAYYVSTGEGAYPTAIYVVNDEYAANAATLKLADGAEIVLTTYAPNMANGDYNAVVGDNAIGGDTSVYIGGNRTAVSLSDLTDTENFKSNEAAAAWYLRSGITNAGASLTTFGDTMYGYEYAVALYRLFQIVVDQFTTDKDYVEATDFSGAMFSNDPYSDAVSATIQAGVWNGIYTRMTDVKDSGDGYYLLTNIDEETRTLGTGAVVTTEFAYVGMYNAFASCWSMLNEEGKIAFEWMEDAAAEYDGEARTAPDDYSNEAKIYAVAKTLIDENGGEAAAAAREAKLSKIEAVSLLHAARIYVKSKTAPDAAWAEQTGSSNSDMSQYFQGEYANPEIELLNGETRTYTNETISLHTNADKAADAICTSRDLNTGLDGAEAAMGVSDPENGGFVYNATARNAFYRDGIGAALVAWNSRVDLRSDNGSLVIDGEASGSKYPAGTMAGAVYVGFGSAVNVTNAVAYSAGQHLSNLLYNGSIHYVDSAAFGSGRVFSSDFWGGYQVFEDSIATGGSVTDEPTTLVVKNSIYANSVGGNGFASQYFENSILNVGSAAFQNTTSLVTDTGALTLVNSQMNNSGSVLASSTKGERLIVTLVDSDVTLAGNTLASVDNYSSVNNISMGTVDSDEDAYRARFNGEMAIVLVGENTITTSDGKLTASVAEGASLTVYGSIVDEQGNAIDLSGRGVSVIPGEGRLVVKSAPVSFSDVTPDRWFAAAVDFVVERKLITGTPEGEFLPNDTTDYSMIASILYRMANTPAVSGQDELKAALGEHWYTDAMVWATASGVGIDAQPGDSVARQDLAAMLYRFAEHQGEDVSASEPLDSFSDAASVRADCVEAMQWAVACGIMQGNDGQLDPDGSSSRAEVATLLMNYFQK